MRASYEKHPLMVLAVMLQIFESVAILENVTDSERATLRKGRENRVYNATHLLDQLLTGYDPRLRPGFQGPALVVDVNLNIRSMGPISEMDMAYQMDCYFRQSWVDRRLVFNGTLQTLPVSINVLDRLWKPDTHFFNGKNSYLHTVTSPNKLLRINQDGRILYSMRLTIKASCPMHLETFPMDTQTCPLRFGSHGYGLNDLIYVWTHGPERSIVMASDMTLSQFDLIGFPHGNDSSHQPHRGLFTSMWVFFKLRRHTGYFLINVYVPCSMLVVISWVGFWINREATSDRIALGVTTVLTMAFLGIDNRRDLPKVSYSTALDYYVGTCFAFVLATILQFAGVHYYTKVGSGERPDDYDDGSDLDADEGGDVAEEIKENKKVKVSDLSPDFFSSASTVCSRLRGFENPVDRPRSSDFKQSSACPDQRVVRWSCCSNSWRCFRGRARHHQLSWKTARSDEKNVDCSTGNDVMNSVSRLDVCARAVFPVAFIVFNIFYWISYADQNISDRTIKR